MNLNEQITPKNYKGIYISVSIVFLFFAGAIAFAFYSLGKSDSVEAFEKVKPLVQNNLDNSYYETLKEECNKMKYEKNDCLKSVEIMEKNGYKKAGEDGQCPDGFDKNTLKCTGCFIWCEPID